MSIEDLFKSRQTPQFIAFSKAMEELKDELTDKDLPCQLSQYYNLNDIEGKVKLSVTNNPPKWLEDKIINIAETHLQ